MGELRTKERRKNDRVYIGHQDGKQNRTVIISPSGGETVVHHALHIGLDDGHGALGIAANAAVVGGEEVV